MCGWLLDYRITPTSQDLTKTATSTINIRKYIPLFECTLAKDMFNAKKRTVTGNKKKKAFGVGKIMPPLARTLYKAP